MMRDRTLRIRSTTQPKELRELSADFEALLGLRIDTAGDSSPDHATVLLDAHADDLDAMVAGTAPVLMCLKGDSGLRGPTTLVFTESERLDRRLRKARFPMEASRFVPVPLEPGDEVLALAGTRPVWIQRSVGARMVDVAGIVPDPEASTATHQAESERIVQILPLIHFARRVAGYDEQMNPPLRACFVIEDPSLQWLTYGYLRFRHLAQHAETHGYHVSIATIPLDTAFYHPRVVRLFRERPDQLSVSIHGNNHTKREFAAHGDLPLRIIAQAVRRIERFEQRTGLNVDRVAIPPHGGISNETVDAAAMLGLHGVVASPWALIEANGGSGNAIGVMPTPTGTQGIPLLIRRHLSKEEEWLPLHAFLDQPMIIYLHHEDLAGGLTPLGSITDRLGRIGSIKWCSLGEMVRSSYIARSHGDTMHLWPFANHVTVRVPEDIHSVVIEYGGSIAPDAALVRGDGGEVRVGLGSAWQAHPGELLGVRLQRQQVDPYTVPAPPWRPWPVVRRMMTMARDRLRPLVRR